MRSSPPGPVERPARRASWVVVGTAVLAVACHRAPPRDLPTPPGAASAAPAAIEAPHEETGTTPEMDLVEAFRNGAIDTAGPVVDLGEAQAAPFIVGAAPVTAENVNGDSWAAVGPRLRLRVPLTPSGVIDDPGQLPTVVRLRVRHATARGVAVIADGLLVRTAALPPGGATGVLSLQVPPDRFRNGVAELELRFTGPHPATPAGQAPAPLVEVDWVHLARTDAPPTRVADLVNDVRVEPTPRRALTLYAPTTLSAVRVIPPGATWRAAVAAEAPRGASRAPLPVVARLRAEADGAPPVEVRTEVIPNTPWRDVALDLRSLGGRPVRLSVSAESDTGSRLALASPRIEAPGTNPRMVPGTARHVVLVIVRGARLDRFVPTVSPRLSGGGFARLAREGTVLPVAAPAARELSALVSATTGLAADLHRMAEATDLLDEDAPTLATVAAAAGVATRAYTDDAAWVGSGADRGFAQRWQCPNDAATCRPDPMFAVATDDLLRGRDRPSLTVVVTRAGVTPFDPAPDVLATLDPQPYEGSMTPAQTGILAVHSRRNPPVIQPRERDRMALLYDAALLGVDRALGLMLDRLRDAGLDGTTLVIVVGDRGSALDDGGYVGDGPMTLAAVSTTVLMARGPGVPAGGDAGDGGVVGVVDAAATALAALGVAAPAEWDALPLVEARARWGRWLPVLAGGGSAAAVRFCDLLAMSRPTGVAMVAPLDDPLGATDLAATRPVARAFAEAALAALRPGVGERRAYQPSTRVLPPPVEAAMHAAPW